MTNIRRAVSRTLMIAAIVAIAPACSDKFLQVENPNFIDASTVDPAANSANLANSAQQNYAAWYGYHIMYSAWFSTEAHVADTFPTRNEFGYRQVENQNGDLSTLLWSRASLAAASAKIVLDLNLPTPATNVSFAQAAMVRGFAILDMAIDFCQVTLSGGPTLTKSAAMDSANYWFSKAITVGTANGSATALSYVNAALVGRARSELQQGKLAAALADASLVPASFNMNVNYTDDPNNRGRLSNIEWQFTFDRGSIDVPAAFQVTGDPRLLWNPPSSKFPPQDVVPGGFFTQAKYPGYATPERLASGMEAQYIAAEASASSATQLTLINARRAANGQAAYAGATDAASVLKELYTQRAYEFWLEGKHMMDMERNAAATPFVSASGSTYIKPGYPTVGTQTCWILPFSETSTNPNYTP